MFTKVAKVSVLSGLLMAAFQAHAQDYADFAYDYPKMLEEIRVAECVSHKLVMAAENLISQGGISEERRVLLDVFNSLARERYLDYYRSNNDLTALGNDNDVMMQAQGNLYVYSGFLEQVKDVSAVTGIDDEVIAAECGVNYNSFYPDL